MNRRDAIDLDDVLTLLTTGTNVDQIAARIGVRAGMSGAEPRCSVDEAELHIPIRPASADPDFGLGIPGFSISYRGPIA